MTRGFRIGRAPPPGADAQAPVVESHSAEGGRVPARDAASDSDGGDVEAAFFDLDKTVIARASIMAFARDFRREGLLTRRAVAQGLWTQFVYIRVGASSKKLERIRRSVLGLTRGWDQAGVREIVTGRLGSAIDPITYAEARELIGEHRRAGRRVYLASAAPAEIVEPLAWHLGFDGVVASIARIDVEGRYTGELEQYAYGAEKARLIEELAARDGVNLAASYAYSDSATDVPMLEAVGHPVAVNPDRGLRRIARQRAWATCQFTRRLSPDASDEAERGRAAAAAPDPGAVLPGRHGEPGWVGSASWARWGSAAAAVAAAAGGAGAVAWRYRSQLGST
jgi:HAD superfamily hydrolase (TIGR01490 family)